MTKKTLIFFSGLIGLLSGIYFADWQYSVESAQHLTGRASFFDESAVPNYYYYSAHSLTNYIGIALLKIIDSEVITSIVISILISIIASITIALLAYQLIKNSYLSLLASLFIFATKFIGDGGKLFNSFIRNSSYLREIGYHSFIILGGNDCTI